MRTIRDWFFHHGVVEVEVPMMVPSPGMEPHLRAFALSPQEATQLGARYLHTSPEYAIKTVLGALEFDVYTMVRSFRDEPLGRMHHPEFTMLEWYRQGVDYHALTDDVEGLIRTLAEVLELPQTLIAPAAVELWSPFERITCEEAFQRYVGVSLRDVTVSELATAAAANGVDADERWGWDGLFTVLYAECVEPRLGSPRPTFITEFPRSQAALARLKPGDPAVAERFEFYLAGAWDRPPYRGGIELANAFSELTDAEEQAERFEAERANRRAAGLPVYPMPAEMLKGVATMRPTAGIALGVERLLVWLWEAKTSERISVADLLLGEPR